MLKTALVIVAVILASGTASADWGSSWGKEGVEDAGKRTPDTTAEDMNTGTRERTRETIAGERPRDENAPVEPRGEIPPEMNENSGTVKE